MRIDAILTNLSAVTVDPARPSARRIGIHHGRIVALDDDLDGVTATEVIDLDGATVVPGFDDAHNHMILFGLSLTELDLSTPPMHTLEQVYDAVAECARSRPPGSWIIGSGYDQNKLGGHPHRDRLDAVAPDHRVWLRHNSAHMSVVGGRLLREIGERPPSGGVVHPDSGLLEEAAQQLVRDLRYPLPREQLVQAITAASERYRAEGITSCTEAGVGLGWIGHSPTEAAAYQDACDAGALGVRVRLMVTGETIHALDGVPGALGLDLGLRTGLGDDRLRLGAVKVFADGSLIGRTAAMHDDFADQPGNRGYFQLPAEELRERIIGAHAAGWQVAAHAIGDRAIDLVLDAFAEAQARFPRADPRHRIEHCGVAGPGQVARLAELGVIPVPQHTFVAQIGDGMRTALGEDRVPWCYRHRSFLDAGIVVPGSSDRPVVRGAPLLGMRAMVDRRTESGEPFTPKEAVTPLEALRAYTLGSAHAAFEEDRKGSITPGKLADLAVLSADPTAAEDLAGIRVLATLVGGRLQEN